MNDPLIHRLIRLAARPLTAPTCPFDGTELDLHFHGGASCPQCGHEFELGQNDAESVIPSDRSIDEYAAQWPDTIPAHFAEWMPQLQEQSTKPWPFIYHPQGGWLTWGRQNGLHDEITNSLYQQGIQPRGLLLYGRWYPSTDQVHIYDPEWKNFSPRDQEKHLSLIRRNAPETPQEAPGGPSSDFWGTVSSIPGKDTFPPEEEWVPTIPTLDEMVEIERIHRPVE